MRRTLIGFLVLGLLFGAVGGCCKKTTAPCVQTHTAYSNPVATYVFATGAPVATFVLTQNYGSGCSDQSDGGPISLKIVSNAPVGLAYQFQVRGLNGAGAPIWSYTNVVNGIGAFQTINVGVIATSAVPVDVGAAVLLTSVTPLEPNKTSKYYGPGGSLKE